MYNVYFFVTQSQLTPFDTISRGKSTHKTKFSFMYKRIIILMITKICLFIIKSKMLKRNVKFDAP